MKNLIVLFIIAFVSLCESGNYINWFEIEPNKIARKLHPGSKTKIQFSDPFFKVEENKKEISTFTRHHVIPFSRVRLFFNNALKMDSFMEFFCESLYKVMNFFTEIASTDGQFENISIGNERDNYIMQLIFALSNSEREALFKNLNNRDAVKRDIHRFFVWFPANIFIGPTDRSDDPGDEFEINASYVIGYRRYNVLKEINMLMIVFNDRVANSKIDFSKHEWAKGDLDTIHLVFVKFKSLVNLSSVPFNAEHWERASETKWRIKLEYFGDYQNVFQVYSPDLASNYAHYDKNQGLTIKDVTPHSHNNNNNGNAGGSHSRKIRSSWQSTHGICMYDDIERQIKSSLNASCVPKNPKCGCF